MEKFLVFVIQGFNQIAPEDGTLLDSVKMELIDTTYEKALVRAKKLVKKNNWRLSMVVENYRHDSK